MPIDVLSAQATLAKSELNLPELAETSFKIDDFWGEFRTADWPQKTVRRRFDHFQS